MQIRGRHVPDVEGVGGNGAHVFEHHAAVAQRFETVRAEVHPEALFLEILLRACQVAARHPKNAKNDKKGDQTCTPDQEVSSR